MHCEDTKRYSEQEIAELDRQFAEKYPDLKGFWTERSAERMKKLGLTQEEYKKLIFDEYCEATKDDIEITNEEKAFRRGFSHGFFTARNNPNLTQDEVQAWKESRKELHPIPPGMKEIFESYFGYLPGQSPGFPN